MKKIFQIILLISSCFVLSASQNSSDGWLRFTSDVVNSAAGFLSVGVQGGARYLSDLVVGDQSQDEAFVEVENPFIKVQETIVLVFKKLEEQEKKKITKDDSEIIIKYLEKLNFVLEGKTETIHKITELVNEIKMLVTLRVPDNMEMAEDIFNDSLEKWVQECDLFFQEN